MNEKVYADLLRQSLQTNADRDCFHIKRNNAYQTWTYGDFHRDLNRLVSVLKSFGYPEGFTAAVIGANCPEWVIAYHGPMLARGCIVPIDPNIPGPEITEIIRLTRARIVFCSRMYLSLFEKLKSEFDFIDRIVVLEPDPPDGQVGFSRFIAGGDPDTDALDCSLSPDDHLAILFTSGTTGKAKGVMLTQQNFTTVSRYGVPRMKVDSSDTMIAILPLHHVFGFAACCAATLPTGIDVVFIPAIKGPLILEGLNDKKVSILPAVPQMLELFYENIYRNVNSRGAVVKMIFSMLKAVSSSAGTILGMNFRKKLFGSVHKSFGGNIQCIISGGSSLRKQYFDGFRLMGFNIVEGYGLTETFGPITLCPVDGPRQASVGKVLEGNEMKISGPNADGIGEVLFRGETVFPGYYNNDEATKAVFDDQGWFHTGDLGRITDDGYLYITGRAKDVIVLSSGKNVYPEELEQYYSTSPRIEEIGIFGWKQTSEESVAAVIVPSKETRTSNPVKKSTRIINEELARMGQNLPTYKKIGTFVVSYQAIPRTTTRKIIKGELEKLFVRLKEPAIPSDASHVRLSYPETQMMESVEFKTIAEYIKKVSPGVDRTALTPRAHLQLDCALDSLKSLDLVCMLEEKYSCTVPMESLTKIETIGDAVRLVNDLRSNPREQQAAKTGPAGTALRRRPGAKRSERLEDNSTATYRILPDILLSICRLLWNVRVRGTENIPADHPVIFAANHQSAIDVMMLVGALPWEIRKKTFTIGKIELRKAPVVGTVAAKSNMIPVERDGDIAEALKASHIVIENNKNLIIFPEGTRTRDGEIGTFKSGIGSLVMETGIGVIPIRITNAFEVFPAGKMPKIFGGRKHRPGLVFGKELTCEILKADFPGLQCTADDIAHSIEEVIRSM
ncbi:MAG: AMP-binding protein [Chitinivibrionales bacterium]|nr:AMP-binding protein [Chitinivibrionales bacterium]